ncbi:hypothetical protein [Streptomyces sp. NPDC006552]|uniref:hypothetical protein n=1 Tax=Streptomyces sp. NPDC006552 TaxID=3157179 RepID=UPI0033B40F95
MAKNKNRKQSGDQNRSSGAERGREEVQKSTMEAQSTSQATLEPQAMGSPSDVARKHKKRFGHN